MKVVVVIPTYNEAENIGRLIPVLAEKFREMPHHEFKILVVDANSPDGTADVVRKVRPEFPFAHVLVEEKKAGLGAAYMLGFNHAINHMGADVVVEMDADFQHNPGDLKLLIAGIDEGYDYVLGSRYMRGVHIPKEWAFYRRFLSIGGNIFAKVVLGIFTISDFTTGFKATRVKGFLDRIELASVGSKGFAYKMDLLYRMYKMGAKIKEVPIVFGVRDRGDSKMEKDNVMDSLKVVLRIRIRENQSFFRFLAVGTTGLVADSSIFNLLRIAVLGSSFASAVSGFVAMFVTYTLNNLWSFEDRRKKYLADNAKSFLVFTASSYVPILFRSWLVHVATSFIADTVLVANAAFLAGVVVGLIWNFTVYSRFIWKKV
ncbi:glycosyltransferase family 2 protein [candidate division WWE3 bacterium]|nr:glycosyltransferase family 2 protein [candidate division WWE3 bacterium]